MAYQIPCAPEPYTPPSDAAELLGIARSAGLAPAVVQEIEGVFQTKKPRVDPDEGRRLFQALVETQEGVSVRALAEVLDGFGLTLSEAVRPTAEDAWQYDGVKDRPYNVYELALYANCPALMQLIVDRREPFANPAWLTMHPSPLFVQGEGSYEFQQTFFRAYLDRGWPCDLFARDQRRGQTAREFWEELANDASRHPDQREDARIKAALIKEAEERAKL